MPVQSIEPGEGLATVFADVRANVQMELLVALLVVCTSKGAVAAWIAALEGFLVIV